MIRVQLCPINELENPYWYVLDLVVLILIGGGAWFCSHYYLESVQLEIQTLTALRDTHTKSFQDLAPALDKFKNLDKDIADLNEKINALKSITVSKISKLKPIIVMEHLQTLRPQGMWYTSVKISEDNSVAISGNAFDNILVAEFMLALSDWDEQKATNADLRTQVAFQQIALGKSTFVPPTPGDNFFMNTGYSSFDLTGKIVEKTLEPTPTAVELKVSSSESSSDQARQVF